MDIAGTMTAAVIVPVVTLGRARVELKVRPDREMRLMPIRQDDGTWLVKEDAASLIGILFWVAVVAGIAALIGRG